MVARALRAARVALGPHRALVLVLVLAAALRIAVAVAYHPALFFAGDSSQYLKLALTGSPVGIADERPSGYPLLVHAVFWLGRDLALLTALQHVAGLVTGVLTYALVGRLGAPRPWAVAVAALVLLDAYAIALEQHVLAEAFFTPMLVGAMLLAVRPTGPGRLVAGGVLLGVAATLRSEAVFAVPVWLVYVAWSQRSWRLPLLAAVACAAPLVAYASWHDAREGSFSLTTANGWFLYARIGEIGDCAGAHVPAAGRRLCDRVPRDDERGASYHLWDPQGTAHRAFGSLTGSRVRQRRINGILLDHALAIIRDRPLRYAGMVAADMGRYFVPGVGSRSISDTALSLPRPGDQTGLDPRVSDRWFPGLRTEVKTPAAALRIYARWVHTPRWLLALLIVTAVVAVVRRQPHRREVLLLVGVPLSILLGATATSDFILRYLIPVTPLLLSGGTIAVLDLFASARTQGSVSRAGEPPRGPVKPPTPLRS